MSATSDANAKFEAAQAKRIAEVQKLQDLVAVQTKVHGDFDNGSVRTLGSVVIPKAANDIWQQMQSQNNQADADVEAQKLVVSAAYAAEQQANQDAINAFRAALNVGAGSIL